MTNLIWFSDIDEEAVDSRAEVKTFDKAQLKHVQTKEDNTLPGAGGTVCISTLNPIGVTQMMTKHFVYLHIQVSLPPL